MIEGHIGENLFAPKSTGCTAWVMTVLTHVGFEGTQTAPLLFLYKTIISNNDKQYFQT